MDLTLGSQSGDFIMPVSVSIIRVSEAGNSSSATKFLFILQVVGSRVTQVGLICVLTQAGNLIFQVQHKGQE